MHGPVPAPPPRSTPGTGVIVARVALVALCVLSIGILAWGALLAVAIMRRRPLDWVLFAGSVVVTVLCLAVVGSLPESDVRTDIAVAVLLLHACGVIAWYLVADIRHRRVRAMGTVPPAGPYAPYLPPGPYGYAPQPQPLQPQARHAPPLAQHSQPQPAPPPHHRIGQVRAELDELSDYLRKERDL